jgi:hypothetical protein
MVRSTEPVGLSAPSHDHHNTEAIPDSSPHTLAVEVDLAWSFLATWVIDCAELTVVVSVALPDPAGFEAHGS